MQETSEMQVLSLGLENPLEEGMATHSSILARRIPWTEEPGGLQSMRSQSQTLLKRLSMHAKFSLLHWAGQTLRPVSNQQDKGQMYSASYF